MGRDSARGGVTVSDFNTPGPRPGSTKAISQRKAIGQGYEAAPTKRCVKTSQKQTETRGTTAPGLTSHRKGRR
jgi:hypothetical protein